MMSEKMKDLTKILVRAKNELKKIGGKTRKQRNLIKN
jgi:hypothetical protein